MGHDAGCYLANTGLRTPVFLNCTFSTEWTVAVAADDQDQEQAALLGQIDDLSILSQSVYILAFTEEARRPNQYVLSRVVIGDTRKYWAKMQHLRPKVVKAVTLRCCTIDHIATVLPEGRSDPETRPPPEPNPIQEQPTNLVAVNLKRSATVIRFSRGLDVLDGTVENVQGFPPDHLSHVRRLP